MNQLIYMSLILFCSTVYVRGFPNDSVEPDCNASSSVTGPCRAHLLRYSYNKHADECVQFTYGGCDGNGNRFNTQQECLNTCKTNATELPRPSVPEKCTLKSDAGLCQAYFKRFFFNLESGKCEEFVYGGCGGNQNNFETEDQCLTECGVKEVRISNPCTQHMDVGPCYAIIRRFYFNAKSGKCEEFNYGGCQGNENNFKTIEECEHICPSATAPVPFANLTFDPACDIPTESGPCEAHIKRYYYNPTSKQCEQFIYGGCQGNQNNYETLEMCNDRCITHHAHL